MSVILETTIGDIVVDLYVKDRPRACLNFLKLCKVKFYNFSLFHKVENNFIAQSGDPTGTGRGGESIYCKLYGEQARYFEAEMTPRLKHTKVGTLSMVNDGSDMLGSQFFITLAEDLDYLDGKHNVFGEVAEGFEVIEKFNEIICDETSRPYQDVRINHTIILDDPFDDPKGLEIPDHSPKPTKEQLANSRIGADEEIDDTKGKSLNEIEEEIQDKEAKARATILEMVGDLPDAEAKPEDNVLFVCKLNPVTTDEDLEIIFSRFGTIKTCEVIRDKKSGESLQYAFIEFSNPSECENAYFKMDNVLIDDRRIHVDFSQSVAHLTWKRKGPNNDNQQKSKYEIKPSKKKDDYDLIFDDDDNNEQKSKSSSERHKKSHKHSSHRHEKKEKYHKSSSRHDDRRRDERSYKKRRHSSSDDSDDSRKRKHHSKSHKSHKERDRDSRSYRRR